MKTKTLVLSLSLAILGGGAAALYTTRHAAAPAANGEAASAAGGGSEAASAGKPSRFDRSRAPGLRHTYAARFDQDLALAGGTGGAKVRLRVSGEL